MLGEDLLRRALNSYARRTGMTRHARNPHVSASARAAMQPRAHLRWPARARNAESEKTGPVPRGEDFLKGQVDANLSNNSGTSAPLTFRDVNGCQLSASFTPMSHMILVR